ncbi:unnamed protein product [Protopolystoma xenopodis]|uniref:Uncharacterized protein n=1 Tax=Protopolystoma xenopodis TaxID=117903 RepID=A0A448WKT6_9PLAT|nr:unnamed protein product [Protopolystoma xenopodis]
MQLLTCNSTTRALPGLLMRSRRTHHSSSSIKLSIRFIHSLKSSSFHFYYSALLKQNPPLVTASKSILYPHSHSPFVFLPTLLAILFLLPSFYPSPSSIPPLFPAPGALPSYLSTPMPTHTLTQPLDAGQAKGGSATSAAAVSAAGPMIGGLNPIGVRLIQQAWTELMRLVQTDRIKSMVDSEFAFEEVRNSMSGVHMPIHPPRHSDFLTLLLTGFIVP